MTPPTNVFTRFATVAALLCTSTAGALAATSDAAQRERVTASTGYQAGAHDRTDPVRSKHGADESLVADKYLADGVPASKARSSDQHSASYSGFWIYDAWVELYFDVDGDGFFSGIDVTFDADTDYFAADVYARLYLSLEGGPWILYYTTDVFTLLGTSGDDDYTVETDLVDGYPTGYYDVLIELYDYEYDELVASFGPYESSALVELPLEDESRDVGIIASPAPPVSLSSGGGGSAGLLTLLAATLLFRLSKTALSARASS